ncbi:flagellar biosynthesis protein FlhB [Pseudobutyrivibrio xylanivorans]|uniref:Flagellar biosynthetic protein FlhB n=1 Tax=Pseudobutyrivibrio xylanivorans DSM 14809 TaxID=1123012 RepID=A0A1M6EIQ3_PSEXY|nr:flagellar biosynthesis protein FlhB [Pseudobutyrivibrio xylanivorans]SHI85319.1 flagellar biosynthetic protein FlhB [Pseudobutyrivibrio xylanivorans DSM 14809]
MTETRVLLFPYNLQFFADGEGGEKTEQPTSKKLTDARNEGKVAKSKEIVNGIALLGFFFALSVFLSFAGVRFEEIFAWIYSIIPDVVSYNGSGLTIHTITGIFRTLILKMLIILLPFFVIGFFTGFVTNLVQVGWKLTLKPLQPKLSKFNPVSGFKRIFSKDSIVNLIMALAKIFLVCYIAYVSIRDQAGNLFILYDIGLKAALSLVFKLICEVGIKISIVYIILGFIDYAYQKWKFTNDMKMTKQEVKDEYKNTEGDPKIKGKQRQKMMETSQRRMMKNVPQADVVITNPTHIAVAILYDNTKDEAPRVIAKGEDYLAKKIKETATESGVPIVENKPLARALYATVDIDQTIPPELYQAVAEILAVVYTERDKAV